jgi:DNA polymerase III subunit delta'
MSAAAERAAAHADWGIIGHEAAVEQLAASVAAGRVSHAYLITGPAGVGRTTLALALAHALNCEAPVAERPCYQCDACRRIARRAHPDVTVADMAWQEEMIPRKSSSRTPRQDFSIDAIRWLRQDISTRPLLGRWKLHILDASEKLSDHAPDAYLKTLEEPPPYAIIIMIAENEDVVSETIRSRCRHIALGGVPMETIRSALLARGTDASQADTIARAARGRIAWALRMAAKPDQLVKRREQIEDGFEKLVSPLGRVEITGTIARDYTKKRETTMAMLEVWLGLWRDALLLRVGLNDEIAYPELSDRLTDVARAHEIDELYRAIWSTQRCMSDLGANVQARIALHAMVMQWPTARMAR